MTRSEAALIFCPALLLIGSPGEVALAVASATAGSLLLAASLHGYLLIVTPMWQRAALLAASLSLINPGVLTDALGVFLGGGVLVLQIMARRRGDSGAAPRAT